jgi:hypothetical protein
VYCFYVYLFLFVLSLLVKRLLPPSDSSSAVSSSSNNNNNNNKGHPQHAIGDKEWEWMFTSTH